MGEIWRLKQQLCCLQKNSGDDGTIVETDPEFTTWLNSPVGVSFWPNDAGYLTSFDETDPTVPSHVKAISTGDIGRWDEAHGWGNHALAGYLTNFTETDPTVPTHVKAITTGNIADWNTAFGWGNHATAGYYLESNPQGFVNKRVVSGTFANGSISLKNNDNSIIPISGFTNTFLPNYDQASNLNVLFKKDDKQSITLPANVGKLHSLHIVRNKYLVAAIRDVNAGISV
jgi:hypothetical protein